MKKQPSTLGETMKCKMLCIAVLGLNAIALAQPSPLLLQNLPAKDKQSVVVTSTQQCDSNGTCTFAGVDIFLAGGLAAGGNRYDSKGNAFLLRQLQFPQGTEIWLMDPKGNLSKFADLGGQTQTCTADSNGATQTTVNIQDFSFNLVDNSLRVLTFDGIDVELNGNGWVFGCDAAGIYAVPISVGTGNPQETGGATLALLKITGPVL
jgi:hypothetical protein